MDLLASFLATERGEIVLVGIIMSLFFGIFVHLARIYLEEDDSGVSVSKFQIWGFLVLTSTAFVLIGPYASGVIIAWMLKLIFGIDRYHWPLGFAVAYLLWGIF